MLSNPGPWIRQCIWQGRNELVLEALGRHPKFLCARFSGNVTPLLAAAYAKQRDLAEKLLAMGAKLDYITAIALNRREIVETMLEQEPRLIQKQAPDRIGSLHVAAHFADGDLVSMLLSRGADANDSKNPKNAHADFLCLDGTPQQRGDSATRWSGRERTIQARIHPSALGCQDREDRTTCDCFLPTALLRTHKRMAGRQRGRSQCDMVTARSHLSCDSV
jgi:hypothetical protein